VLGLNSEAASIISEYSSTLPKKQLVKGFQIITSRSDVNSVFLANHQPRLVAGLRQHALSVRLNQMKMGSEKKWDCAAKKEKSHQQLKNN